MLRQRLSRIVNSAQRGSAVWDLGRQLSSELAHAEQRFATKRNLTNLREKVTQWVCLRAKFLSGFHRLIPSPQPQCLMFQQFSKCLSSLTLSNPLDRSAAFVYGCRPSRTRPMAQSSSPIRTSSPAVSTARSRYSAPIHSNPPAHLYNQPKSRFPEFVDSAFAIEKGRHLSLRQRHHPQPALVKVDSPILPRATCAMSRSRRRPPSPR